jgi:hypothetical protein
MESVKRDVKAYAGPAVAASLMHAGILQFVSVLSRRLADVLVRLINVIIQTGFRDRTLLRDVYSGETSWRVQTIFVALGVIAITLGIFVGVWVNSKSQCEPAP